MTKIKKQFSSRSSSIDFAFVIDVDGVLLRGRTAIPRAAEGIEILQNSGIPHLLVTNGGGRTEKEMALKISAALGVSLEESQMQMSHTPLKFMPDEVKKSYTLALGPGKNTRHLMESYGFTNVITADEFHALYPTIWPDEEPMECEIKEEWHQPIENVVVVYTPAEWYRDLQIACDMVRSNGIPGTLVDEQRIPLYFAGPDFEYAAEMNVPRLGAGAFLKCLEHLFHLSTGQSLNCCILGKPKQITYNCAMQLLQKQAENLNCKPLRIIYAIGDNPSTDIAGANSAGSRWTSVLVETGLFQKVGNLENDIENPADLVYPDFYSAVTGIMELGNGDCINLSNDNHEDDFEESEPL
eukprot:CAMPEP_0117779622 /NCGR_PEP_ID=MMETSP0948-20121206/1725_1 /TAXON_ID=44440 /ORGANISM="Chattonella subsalsa, Strain CCMP2191" /LENGTH=353 /DNA_ID=CAMNT_0005607227 /DNA_START=176 /DNA_END=1237 /DNA_ORIENTATION=+